jgi:hypothetical protein
VVTVFVPEGLVVLEAGVKVLLLKDVTVVVPAGAAAVEVVVGSDALDVSVTVLVGVPRRH